ncbi:MAG: alkaline phosphatase family protein [Burkholderiales bacterium]|nr:alkaline phosphatase family protein [Burkholderiales bacterium]
MKRRELLTGGAALAAAGGCAAPGGQPGTALPAAPAQAPLRRIALGSCFDQTKAAPIWDTITASRPDLFLFGGDNIYCQMPYSLPRLREAYALAAASPGLSRLRAAVPHMAIWDDNDYGLNDGGADFTEKLTSKAEFLQFWQAAADDPRRGREGLYDARMFGPPGRRVQVILLDTRWFRSAWKRTDQRDAPGKERYVPDADPAKTVLGEVQWRWLEAQLRQPAEVRLLFSGMQVVTQGHGWERWGNLPLERERLYRLIGDTGAQGVVVLSGDRHIGALYREDRGTAYPLYELTASGFTHTWTTASEAGPNRLGELYRELHYGAVEIDWDSRSLRLDVVDTAGLPQRSQSIAFNELRARP